MLPQQKKGWTTVVDLEDYKKMTWSYLTNIKQTWQYDGIAYIFRKRGIHLYGRDCGSLKMNHPILTIGIPQHKDKNYGVDLYVPVEKKAQALSLIKDWDRIREYAELEQQEGKAAHKAFEAAATEAKQRNAEKKRVARREKFGKVRAQLFS